MAFMRMSSSSTYQGVPWNQTVPWNHTDREHMMFDFVDNCICSDGGKLYNLAPLQRRDGKPRFAKLFIAEPARQRASGAPLLRKFGNLSIREILVVTSAYVRPSARTDPGGGGEESQDNPTGGGECHLFLAGNRAVPFGQQAFFLAGNRMTTVTFEKEVFVKV